MNFVWADGQLPKLEDHSRAKLKVLRLYLQRYYDRLGSSPKRDLFRLDVIDGFAGGGLFKYQGQQFPGSPLIMLEELEAAKERLSRGRHKPLHFDVNHHFIDSNRQHIDHLKSVLDERGYRHGNGQDIRVSCAKFESVLDDLLDEISQRTPKAGRSIFLLDQCGFLQVDFNLIRKIFGRLKAAEVILTFAADTFINLLHDPPRWVHSVRPIGLTEAQLQTIIDGKHDQRFAVQRLLRDHIRLECGALYDTPFFICPKGSRRALWFIHLSQHPTAHDVMMQCHWNSGNTFLHYGSGGFDFMGWDPLLEHDSLKLFEFGCDEEEQLKNDLYNTLPNKLFPSILNNSISIEELRREIANHTAATFSTLDEVVVELYRSGEVGIRNAQGKDRNKSVLHLDRNDRIYTPRQLRLFINPRSHD